MKLPKLNPGKKLQATARRVRAGVAERAPERAVADYDEEEPVTRLSSAFWVVLLLHVTAFGGIYAFDHIKANRAAVPTTAAVSTTKADWASSSAVETLAVAPATKTDVATPTKVHTEPAERSTVASERKEIQDRTTASAKPAVYTVIKGDNPVTIAHHFGVSYDELLKVNNIEDPKKLQIGQKLKIPGRKLGESSGKLTSQGRSTSAD